MFKIESLKNYTNIISANEFMSLAKRIYLITDFVCEYYPKHKEWYFTKQLPSINDEKRNVLFVRSPEDYNEIIAMACLKKEPQEQKICTLYVAEDYRGQGIGKTLVETSMEWLGTRKPLITLTDNKLEMFAPMIKKYEWELTEIVLALYNDYSKELCFNGKVTKNKLENPNSQKKLTKKSTKNILL